MDNFKGGKFIVGTDIKVDETKRMANELFRNQNENLRLSNETARTNAEIDTKNSLFSQMGIITLIFVIIIILTVLSLLAYEKATNNQSLVDLDNIRKLNLTDLTVYENSNLNTLTLTGDTSSSGGATYTDGVSVDGGLSVGTKSNFYGDIRAYGGVSVQGGLSVDGATNFYGGLDITGGVSMDGGLSVGTTSNLYGEVIAHSGVSVIGGLSINGVANFYDEVHAYKGVSIDAGLSVGTTSNLYGEVHAYKGVSVDGGLSVGTTTNLYGEVHAYQGVSVDGGLSVNGHIVATRSENNFFTTPQTITFVDDRGLLLDNTQSGGDSHITIRASYGTDVNYSLGVENDDDAFVISKAGTVNSDKKLKISGTSVTVYDDLWANKGVSITEGLSVGTTSNLYGEVHAYQGVSVDGGLSVNGHIVATRSENNFFTTPQTITFVDDRGLLLDNTQSGGDSHITIRASYGTDVNYSLGVENDDDAFVISKAGTVNSDKKLKISGTLTTILQPFGVSSIEVDVAHTAAISLLKHASLFVTGGAETSTLAAGTEGQIKVLAMHTDGGNMVVTVTNAGWKSSGTGTITFDTIGDSCTLQYLNSKWFAVGNNACVFNI